MNFRDKLKSVGYDAEEAYFYKLEQELIEKTRAKNRQTSSHLKLLPGGKSEKMMLLTHGYAIKKAA